MRTPVIVLVLLIAHVSPLQASEADKTLAPYFLVEGGPPGLERLPLKDTHVDVAISGVIAEVVVTQTYGNDGDVPIHARYVFPGSTRAAVNGLKMRVGEEVIVAEIKERAQASAEFAAAKEAGKSASMLTQERPNVFTMALANVPPKELIRVELTYTELLVPDFGVYQFVFPTVVGPRYSHTLLADATPADHFVATPYLPQGQARADRFTLDATIEAGMPLGDLRSPSHGLRLAARTAASASLSLDPMDKDPANRDFILEYTLAGVQVASGLLTFDGPDGRYFLMMAEPPKRVAAEMIVPREYIFVLDVSGSMYGFPLDTAKALMRRLLADLRPDERFNVVLFSGRALTLAPSALPASEENIREAMAAIEEQRGGGGTELHAALQTAFALPASRERSRVVVVVTDGFIAEEREAFDLIRDHLAGTNVFAFGIGSSVNRHLIEGVAHAGMGEPFVVTRPEEAPAAAEKLRRYVSTPMLSGLSLEGEGVELYDLEPKAIPDLFASRPIVVTGKWRGDPRGALTLRGRHGHDAYVRRFELRDARPTPRNRPLRQLWARARLTTLSDFRRGAEDETTRAAVVDLGLRYALLTPHTAFIAVHQRVRAPAEVEVAQPLPLPQGVSNLAVGVEQGAEPPLFLIAVLFIALLLVRRRMA